VDGNSRQAIVVGTLLNTLELSDFMKFAAEVSDTVRPPRQKVLNLAISSHEDV
jgi:hypothetical protein